MTLSTSRQQFLAYETQPPEDIGYTRRGGVFLTSCVCVGLVILSVVLAAIVGVIVHYITYFKLSQSPTNYWDDAERFGVSGTPSPDLRLPSYIVPSFYRLKIVADLENSSFTGEVYITIRASKKTKEIILHSKNLTISSNAKLSEQIYEKVETLHARRKRQVENDENINQNQAINNQSLQNESSGNIQAFNTDSVKTEIPLDKNPAPNTEVQNNASVATNDTSIPATNSQQPIHTVDTETKFNENKLNNNTEAKFNENKLNSNTEATLNENKLNSNTEATLNKNKLNSNTEAKLNENKLKINSEAKLNENESKIYSPKMAETVPNEQTTEKTVAPIDSSTLVTHSSVRNIKIITIQEALGDRLVLTLATALKPGVDYTLELSFNGNITNSMTGFYRSNYLNSQRQEKKLGVTQFEPTSARAAFPCFDEPGFKAKFEISIAHRANVSVLSNMKVSSTELMPEKPDWQWTHFERSVKMSTYLVAYIISDFKYLETTYLSKDNISKTIRVWTRSELLHKAKYALSITPKLLEYYEDVFGVSYALDKIDLVGIPDFSSGAMENWGLVTFRETTLLFDETENVPREKQGVAIDVAHELAHQWFGNLVTMQWWTDLWLNEGFATYIEYVGVAHIEREWNMLESFTRDKMDLLRTDALKNTSPVSMQVIDASEISQKFDEISYTKGANLIRMLNHTISEQLFNKGLAMYLNQWKYSNAEENDLWEAMTTATKSDPVLKGRSLVHFMNSWTRQAGYPVVKVMRNYVTGAVVFEQRLFTSAKEPYRKMSAQTWQIPISWTTMDAPVAEWSTKPKLWLTETTATDLLKVNDSQPLYVNVGAIGYYRVNYDSRNWELLSKAIKTGHVKSPIAKAQLIDDAFNLAKSSQLNYSLALSLTTCVIDGEDSKIVWDLLLNNMGFLKHTLKATPGFVHFQDYMKILLKKQLEKLNYGLNKPKDDNEAFLIENLLIWECNMGSSRCLQWAREQFDAWSSQPDWTTNPIPSYLRSLVYNVALKYGGRREFDFLWKVFTNSTDPGIKNIIIINLPATREESLIAALLEKSLNELPKQYAVSAWTVEPPVGPPIAQAFLVNNFDRVYNKFTEMDPFTFPTVVSGAFGFINTQKELDLLKQFAVEHKEKLLPMSVTLQKLVDTATMRIDWIKTHADGITRWFTDYLAGESGTTNNATSRSASSPSSQSNPIQNTDTMQADASVPNPPIQTDSHTNSTVNTQNLAFDVVETVNTIPPNNSPTVQDNQNAEQNPIDANAVKINPTALNNKPQNSVKVENPESQNIPTPEVATVAQNEPDSAADPILANGAPQSDTNEPNAAPQAPQS